jgi:hypothetical protein
LGGEIYRASKGEFDKLYATQANFQNLEAKVANFNNLNTDIATIKNTLYLGRSAVDWYWGLRDLSDFSLGVTNSKNSVTVQITFTKNYRSFLGCSSITSRGINVIDS